MIEASMENGYWVILSVCVKVRLNRRDVMLEFDEGRAYDRLTYKACDYLEEIFRWDMHSCWFTRSSFDYKRPLTPGQKKRRVTVLIPRWVWTNMWLDRVKAGLPMPTWSEEYAWN